MNEIKVIQSEPGKEIIVRIVHARLNEDAWIGLFKAGTGDNEHGDRWKWMRDVDVSHITFPAQVAGEWSVRLFKDGGYDRISYLDFNISYSGSSIEILEAVSDKPVRFKINISPSSNDAWVGIYPVTAGDNEHGNRWKWIRDIDVNNAMLPAQTKGRWSIRVFSDGGYTLHDRVDFDIVSAHNPNMPGTMPSRTMPGQIMPAQHLHDPEKAAEFARALGLSVGGAGHTFVGNWQTKGFYAYRSGKYSGIAYFGSGGSEDERLASPSESEKYRPWNRHDPKIPEDIRQKLIRLEDRMNQTSQPSRNPSDGGGGLDGHYFSFKTGGNPNDIVDRFEARQNGNRVTYYRNGPVGSKSRVNSATANPMESYSISGSTLHGPVTGTIKPNGDIEYSHGYTSRKEGETTSTKPLSRDMLRGENILVSEHSLPKYNGIYTIQNNEINGKPWFKNNSGCILYFYNANSGGGPSWSLDDRSQDGTNDWFRGGWIEPPNSGGPPLGTRSWAILETHRRFEIKIESVSIPHESSEPILNSDGRKYVFAHEHNDWQWHNERARAMGGHLASITNGIENEQITRISGGAPVWIGGIRKGSGNGPSADHWYWDDGRPWSYTNWHPGEPNNSGGGENRVHLGLQAPGTWNDVPDQWHGPAVYLVPNIASATSKSSSPEIDILAQFKSKLEVSDSHLRRIDELSSKYKKK